MDFCHLHLHTIFSILDGINRLDELAKHVSKEGMTSCAITDHGVLHGIVDFYKECKKTGVKPIIGVEAYLTEDEDGIEDNKFKTKDNYHCIMLAQNEVGLRNLIWMTNQGNLHNFYYRPRISIKHLENGRSEGIIATSSCLGGVISKRGAWDGGVKLFHDPDGESEKNLRRMYDIFNGKFYAEIQDNPHSWHQEAYNSWLVNKARDMKIPLVITADAHFLTAEEKKTHDLVMAQQLKVTLDEYQSDEDGLAYGPGHYVRSPEEMMRAAKVYGAEEAFWNTTEISKQCNVNITLGEHKNPTIDITKQEDYEAFTKWRTNKYEC